MSVEKIITVPHAMLRQVADPVTQVNEELTTYLENLGETLRAQEKPPGVGLAFPQINKPLRAFATYLETSQSEEPVLRFFVNPKILDLADKQTLGPNPNNPDLEGCLSIPWLYAPVWRPEWVTLEWQEIEGDESSSLVLSSPKRETFYDFTARVMQHEFDHLNGVLFTDYVHKQGQPLYRSEGKQLVETDPIIIEAWSL
jgi:peptide deformylase